MRTLALLLSAAVLGANAWSADIPDNLFVDGVPPIPRELQEKAGQYLDFRTASFQSWHPASREMLVTTRFAESPQLHSVKGPGAARRQLTFLKEPVSSAAYQPRIGKYILFSQDSGGGEFFQLYRYDTENGRITLLTDGKSRNTNPRWSRDGKQVSYSSTARNGRDTDIYIMNPEDPSSARMVLQVSGGGWYANDWSPDGTQLVLAERLSINQAFVWLLDIEDGTKTLLTPKKEGQESAFEGPRFGNNSRTIYVTTDEGSEFRELCRINIRRQDGKALTTSIERLTSNIKADVEGFDITSDGDRIAFVTNEDGISLLRVTNARSGKVVAQPDLPKGVISGLEWRPDGRELGFTFASARSAGDAYSLSMRSGKVERWTESETSGLNAQTFSEPELVQLPSFDGVQISAFVYRPDDAKHTGRRPVLMLIHGGPESQSRPRFLGSWNYFMNELGMILVVPNVRGSSGYGKTFLTLDNGFKREDTVKDIGTILDWVAQQSDMDKDRVAVIGGSYGGYMVLASMIHHADRLKAGVDIVGISNFLTFLKNTQDYRRDLRRVEYGDERDEKMQEFLERISPSTNARRIKDPLFVIQGLNDPRVPASESEQMVKAVREAGGEVWYLMAKDEGHGFQKKANQDFQFLSTILFLQKHLLQ